MDAQTGLLRQGKTMLLTHMGRTNRVRAHCLKLTAAVWEVSA